MHMQNMQNMPPNMLPNMQIPPENFKY